MLLQVEAELGRYKAAVEELNRKTGSHIDPLADPNDLMKSSTRNLMSAVSSLPGEACCWAATRLAGGVSTRSSILVDCSWPS